MSRSAMDASAAILDAAYGGGSQSADSTSAANGSSSYLPATADLMSELAPSVRDDFLALAGGLLGDGAESMLDGVTELLQAFAAQGQNASAVQGQQDGSQAQAANQDGSSLSASLMHFHLKAEGHSTTTTVTSENGDTTTTQSSDFSIEIEFDQASVQAQQNGQAATADPLVLDLNRDGAISVSDPSSGTMFDINGDGVNELSAFVKGSDGFLALDKNKNGVIDSGKELFGDQNGSASGFEELGKYDSNGDGKIDASDAVFGDLRIATADQNGQISLHALAEYGIQSLDLQSRDTHQALSGGSYLSSVGSYTASDGSKNLMADAQLSYRA